MHFKSTLVAAAGLLAVVPSTAHMTMKYPAPVFSSDNQFSGGKILDTYTAPISGRSQFPCRDPSVLAAIGTEAGTAVDSWTPGSSHNVTITGGAFHGGGSCQLSLSYDQGTTFKVIKSFIGNCPSSNGDTNYNFDVPSDAPIGEAVFAWTWFNKIGNREMYMNCAVVDIGGASKRDISHEENYKRAVAFESRPNIFVANIDGSSGCRTQETVDVDFPNPGDEVERNTQVPGLYIDESACSDPGNTGAGTPGPAGGDSSPDTGGISPSASAPPAEPTSSAAADPTSSEAAGPISIPGGVFITTSVADVATPTAPISEEPTAPVTSVDAPAIPSVTTTASEQPTTLVTSTRAATTSAAGTTTTAPEAPVATAPVTSEGAFTVGEACDSEGDWNCIDGSSFQRCASGMWSTIVEMAPGTACNAGVSDTLIIRSKRVANKRGIRSRIFEA